MGMVLRHAPQHPDTQCYAAHSAPYLLSSLCCNLEHRYRCQQKEEDASESCTHTRTHAHRWWGGAVSLLLTLLSLHPAVASIKR